MLITLLLSVSILGYATYMVLRKWMTQRSITQRKLRKYE